MRTDLLIFIIAACEMEINNCLIRQKITQITLSILMVEKNH